MLYYDIYTDGACSGNPGPGGWGLVIYRNGVEVKTKTGGEKHTTNNRMELTAVLHAAKLAAKRSSDKNCITIYTDSTYVCNGLNEWMEGWKKRGWVTAGNKPTKNADLWKELDEIWPENVKLEWVKGHATSVGNIRADQLATTALKDFK